MNPIKAIMTIAPLALLLLLLASGPSSTDAFLRFGGSFPFHHNHHHHQQHPFFPQASFFGGSPLDFDAPVNVFGRRPLAPPPAVSMNSLFRRPSFPRLFDPQPQHLFADALRELEMMGLESASPLRSLFYPVDRHAQTQRPELSEQPQQQQQPLLAEDASKQRPQINIRADNIQDDIGAHAVHDHVAHFQQHHDVHHQQLEVARREQEAQQQQQQQLQLEQLRRERLQLEQQQEIEREKRIVQEFYEQRRKQEEERRQRALEFQESQRKLREQEERARLQRIQAQREAEYQAQREKELKAQQDRDMREKIIRDRLEKEAARQRDTTGRVPVGRFSKPVRVNRASQSVDDALNNNNNNNEEGIQWQAGGIYVGEKEDRAQVPRERDELDLVREFLRNH